MGDAVQGFGPMHTKHASIDGFEQKDEIDVSLEIKEVSADGTFTGYGSMFNNMDLDRDIIAPGAFSKSLQGKGPKKIKLLWQHDPAQPIGVWESMEEDARGLKVTGRLLINQNVPRA